MLLDAPSVRLDQGDRSGVRAFPSGGRGERAPRLVRRLLLLAVPLAACATYTPRVLDPAQSAADFEARSLADPGLRTFAEEALAEPPPAWPPETWTLPLLAPVAFYFHPDLDVARARVAAVEGKVVAAGARPNPRLGLAPGFIADRAESVSRWLGGVDLQFTIETAGKRDLRVAHAESLARAERIALVDAAWTVWSGLRGAFFDHLFAARALDLAGEEERARGEVADALERRLAAGEASRPDVEEARSALADARRARRAAEGRAAASRGALAASLGLPVRALEGTSFGAPDLERPRASDDFASRARQEAVCDRLDLRRALEEYAAADASYRLELARQFPDLDVGPAYEFDAGENKFRLPLSLVVPLFHRNEGPIAEAGARRDEAAASFLALQARAFAETEASAERCRSAFAELAEAEASLAAASARERAARRALEAGAEDRLDVSFARVARVVADRARLESAERCRAALGALEDAVERPIEPDTPDTATLVSRPGRTAAGAEGAAR